MSFNDNVRDAIANLRKEIGSLDEKMRHPDIPRLAEIEEAKAELENEEDELWSEWEDSKEYTTMAATLEADKEEVIRLERYLKNRTKQDA